ncbi:hypothetical protein V5F63_12610 [Xanthobacter autotrophicus DSM 597]|uniref:hypothetical protein n=1 Tax=Xanthobacter wiegelii TaxID=3119913 RepID=UPI0037293A95
MSDNSITQRAVMFGATYRDRITGFTGIAVGHTVYISGCSQVLLAPPVKPDGSLAESQWFDQQRLKMVAGIVIIDIDNGATPGCDRPAPKR